MGTINSFRGKYEFLSNFYPSAILRPTLEHHYQAAKTLSYEEVVKVLRATTPGEAKRLGRKLTMRSDWEEIKIPVMKKLLEMKFEETELAEQLRQTGDVILIEGNYWHDNFWGVCWCARCKESIPTNWLGKLLMEVRANL